MNFVMRRQVESCKQLELRVGKRQLSYELLVKEQEVVDHGQRGASWPAELV
jgi:hypothetical protein